jgi:antitoxin (DNA-binding transcriptional repressor) of toxin-antitoxin stability system
MRTVTAAEASRRFSDLLDAVEHGEAATITRGHRLTRTLRQISPKR